MNMISLYSILLKVAVQVVVEFCHGSGPVSLILDLDYISSLIKLHQD